MRNPCSNCPWRRAARTGHWDPQHFEDIWQHCQDDGLRVMLCHKATALPEAEQAQHPCQGWLRVIGRDAIGVRIALRDGTAQYEEVDDTARPDLFGSFEEMLLANGITPSPRNRVKS